MTIKPQPQLPEIGFIKLPVVLALIPISKRQWYRGVAAGIYPSATKLTARSSAWKVEEIRDLVKKLGAPAPTGQVENQ